MLDNGIDKGADEAAKWIDEACQLLFVQPAKRAPLREARAARRQAVEAGNEMTAAYSDSSV